MGPKTENVELLKEMIKSGMNVARFNFSHGSHEEHAGRMALVEEARKAVNIPVATMLDTKGPEIRTGSVTGSGRSDGAGGTQPIHRREASYDLWKTQITYQSIWQDDRTCAGKWRELLRTVTEDFK